MKTENNYSDDPIKNELISAEFKRLNDSLTKLEKENSTMKAFIMVTTEAVLYQIEQLGNKTNEIIDGLRSLEERMGYTGNE